MGNEIFFKNIDDNEFIKLNGNSNYSEWEQPDNTLYLMWVMLNKWVGKKVVCLTWRQKDYFETISKSKDVSDNIRNEFIKDKEEKIKFLFDKEYCYENMRQLYNIFHKKNE